MKLSFFSLALNEWRRRPARTAVTVSGVGLAVAALFALLGFERGYRRALQTELDRLGAHVLVVPKGCPYDAASLALHGANWPCYLKSSYLAEVRTIPGISAAVPALMHALRDDTGQPVVYVGTDASMLALRPQWRIAGRFPQGASEILAGAELARRYGWRTGDAVDLPALGGKRGLVCGVLEATHGADDFFVHLPLAEAQRLFRHEHELTHVLVRLRDTTRLDDIVRQLRSCDAGMNLNVVPLAHLFRTIERMADSTRWLLGCVVLVALLIATVGVSNSLLMAVAERIGELGLFRAMGASPADIFRLVHLESVLLCVVGGSLGIVITLAASHGLESWLRVRLPFVPAGQLVVWDWLAALVCVAGATALGSLAAWVPAWRACQISPKEAMQNQGGVT